jgi:putative DNA primase/helicase
VAHQMLFHQTPGPIKKRGVYALIVDESVWRAGLFGTDQSAKTEISLDELAPSRMHIPPGRGPDSGEWLEDLRDRLRQACLLQPDGPLSRDALIQVGFDTSSAGAARYLELDRKITSGDWQTREHNRSLTRMIRLWEAVDHLMNSNGSSLSGRISLVMAKTPDGINFRALRVVGCHEIKNAWRTPTLLIDANFDEELANIYWPEIDKLTRIEVGMPHAQIFQAADRSFSKSMFRTDGKADRRKIGNTRAFILEMDRRLGGITLVISNKEIVEALQLPERFQRAHFNALAGRDEWRTVRTIIIIGRPLPRPEAMEPIAGALTGEAPESIGHDWYPKQDAIRPIWDQIDPSLVRAR